MIKVIFFYNNSTYSFEHNKADIMKNLYDKFISYLGVPENSLCFLYEKNGEKEINNKMTLSQILIKEEDKININVYNSITIEYKITDLNLSFEKFRIFGKKFVNIHFSDF